MTRRSLLACLAAAVAGCATSAPGGDDVDAAVIDAPGATIDAPPDAPVVDAPIDAPTDARIDAPIDAPPDAPIDAAGVTQRIGHVTPLGESSSHSPNFLLGEQLVVPQTFTLRQFGVLMISGGPQLQMALYTDVGGAPGNLVAQTAATPTTAGIMEINPTASGVVLSPGTYWIMGIVNVSASIGFTTGAGANVVQYRSLTFGAALPNPFGPPTNYTGQSFNYYLVVN